LKEKTGLFDSVLGGNIGEKRDELDCIQIKSK